MKQLDTLISRWKNIYGQQGQTGKILISCFSLLVVCFLCSIPVALFRPRNSSNVIPTPYVFPSQGSGATPTALFNFGRETFTPYPTFPSSTAPPTLTSLPTETSTATPIQPIATLTPVLTATSVTATSTPATSAGLLAILHVEKSEEYVDIKNISGEAVNLSGWRLVSELGKQSCELSGVLQPNSILRVWARSGQDGFSCNFPINIWNNDTPDAAVLYNPQGEEESRYP